MLVRRASREEVDRLNAIAMEAKAQWGYEPAQLEEWRPGLLTPPESIDRWPTFVAVVHGEAVGFAQANPERSPCSTSVGRPQPPRSQAWTLTPTPTQSPSIVRVAP
jgi:hypothetical protein